jgi:hypothetical protein
MSCSQFTSLGYEAETVDQVASSSATGLQIKEFKPILSLHVSRIAGFGGLSAKKRAVNHILKNEKKLANFLSLSLVATRVECFTHPNKSLKDVAIKEIDSIIDTVSEDL